MCDHGTTTDTYVFIPASLSYTGKDRWEDKPIDSCIAGLVDALTVDARKNMDRVPPPWTPVQSCCGHGNNPGIISMLDGRQLVICDSLEQAAAAQSVNTQIEADLRAEVESLKAERARAEAAEAREAELRERSEKASRVVEGFFESLEVGEVAPDSYAALRLIRSALTGEKGGA